MPSEIMGSDSFAHLRTLILTILQARVEKEFKAHLGIKRQVIRKPARAKHLSSAFPTALESHSAFGIPNSPSPGQLLIILDIRERVQVEFFKSPPGGLLPQKRLLFRLGHFYLTLIGFVGHLLPRRLMLWMAVPDGKSLLGGHEQRPRYGSSELEPGSGKPFGC